jgi:hypothetical protein
MPAGPRRPQQHPAPSAGSSGAGSANTQRPTLRAVRPGGRHLVRQRARHLEQLRHVGGGQQRADGQRVQQRARQVLALREQEAAARDAHAAVVHHVLRAPRRGALQPVVLDAAQQLRHQHAAAAAALRQQRLHEGGDRLLVGVLLQAVERHHGQQVGGALGEQQPARGARRGARRVRARQRRTTRALPAAQRLSGVRDGLSLGAIHPLAGRTCR